MDKVFVLNKFLSLILVATILGLSLATAHHFSEMTYLEGLDMFFSLDLNRWANWEFQRWCLFFLAGLVGFGVGLYPLKRFVDEIFFIND